MKETALDQIMGVVEAAEKWGISADRVKRYCEESRFPCIKIGKTWIMLKNQIKPTNPRKKA